MDLIRDAPGQVGKLAKLIHNYEWIRDTYPQRPANLRAFLQTIDPTQRPAQDAERRQLQRSDPSSIGFLPNIHTLAAASNGILVRAWNTHEYDLDAILTAAHERKAPVYLDAFTLPARSANTFGHIVAAFDVHPSHKGSLSLSYAIPDLLGTGPERLDTAEKKRRFFRRLNSGIKAKVISRATALGSPVDIRQYRGGCDIPYTLDWDA